MSQNVERARALKLIQKLMDQTTTRGRTQSEMDYAMGQLDKLMKTYNVTMDEVTLQGLEYKSMSVAGDLAKGDPMMNVICAIAEYTSTKTWRTPGSSKWVEGRTPRGRRCMKRIRVGKPTYHFFGISSDVEMAVFLYELIKNSLESETVRFKKSETYLNSPISQIRGRKRSMLYSFRDSFTTSLSWRLYDMARENEKTVELTPESTDLVFCKKSVREQKFKEQMGVKLTSAKSYRTGGSSSSGANAGYSAAKAVNLNRPVGNGGGYSGQLRLGS